VKNRIRVARARAGHKPLTAEKKRIADESEITLAEMLEAKRTTGNAPVDAIVVVNRTSHGIEVKTIIDAGYDKITVHPSSRRRKERWARRRKATLHTVVFDRRTKRTSMYYRAGVGAFRLAYMTPVVSASHLRQLMGL
jgi:hypothetical protein